MENFLHLHRVVKPSAIHCIIYFVCWCPKSEALRDYHKLWTWVVL
jgi:hypothetical protein